MYRTHNGPAKRRSLAAGSNGARKAQAPPRTCIRRAGGITALQRRYGAWLSWHGCRGMASVHTSAAHETRIGGASKQGGVGARAQRGGSAGSGSGRGVGQGAAGAMPKPHRRQATWAPRVSIPPSFALTTHTASHGHAARSQSHGSKVKNRACVEVPSCPPGRRKISSIVLEFRSSARQHHTVLYQFVLVALGSGTGECLLPLTSQPLDNSHEARTIGASRRTPCAASGRAPPQRGANIAAALISRRITPWRGSHTLHTSATSFTPQPSRGCIHGS